MASPTFFLPWFGLALVVAVRLAEPILDGDLFWHMAYARQMIERGTLVLDHTAFSWTPVSNVTIYCAWASELWRYWLAQMETRHRRSLDPGFLRAATEFRQPHRAR